MFEEDNINKEINSSEEISKENGQYLSLSKNIEDKIDYVETQRTYTYDEIKDNINDPRLKRRPKQKNSQKSKIKNYIYAGFWIRMFAFLFDAIIVKGIFNILAYFSNLNTQSKHAYMFYVIVFALYSFICTSQTGQTFGKFLFDIKVVCEGEDDLKIGTLLMREIFGKIILVYLKVIFVFVVFSGKKQSLIDYFTDTSVIKMQYQEVFEKSKLSMN